MVCLVFKNCPKFCTSSVNVSNGAIYSSQWCEIFWEQSRLRIRSIYNVSYGNSMSFLLINLLWYSMLTTQNYSFWSPGKILSMSKIQPGMIHKVDLSKVYFLTVWDLKASYNIPKFFSALRRERDPQWRQCFSIQAHFHFMQSLQALIVSHLSIQATKYEWQFVR